jgi:vacuolar-type H+-ATPase subunit E/Vma4
VNASRPPGALLSLVPGATPNLGGVIFQTDKFEVDLSLDERLARLREELAPQVAEILFRQETGV